MIIGGSRGAQPVRAPPPNSIQFFHFRIHLLPKSAHVGGRHPPNGSAPHEREILDLPLMINSSFNCRNL